MARELFVVESRPEGDGVEWFIAGAFTTRREAEGVLVLLDQENRAHRVRRITRYIPESSDDECCPHATPPFRYCDGCKADPCPLGLPGATTTAPPVVEQSARSGYAQTKAAVYYNSAARQYPHVGTTGDELRKVWGVPAHCDLFMEMPVGPDRRIEGETPVELWPNAVLYCAPKKIG